MVTIMDAYEYHQGNNPGNGDQYLSTDDEDLLDRKDILADTTDFDNDDTERYGGYASHFSQDLQQQEVGSSSQAYYNSAPYMTHMNEIKPLISEMPSLVPPTYLQQTPMAYNYNNDYQQYVGPSTSNNPFHHQSYPYYNKAWYNQVKSEQMANLLNR